MAMDLGPLLGLFLQSFIVQVTMSALAIIIFVIVYGRMIEIYLMVSLCPRFRFPLLETENKSTSDRIICVFKRLHLDSRDLDYDLRGHLCGADSVYRIQ